MPTKRGRGIIYARPSFLEGMARIFDFGGTLNEYDFGPVGRESEPPPAVLQQYDDVLPGSAKGIFQRWETQSDHRMRMESAVITGDSKSGYLGIACAFILSLLMIAIGAYAIIWGNPWVGAAVLGTQTVGLASAFIYGTNSRRRERERKAADANPPRD